MGRRGEAECTLALRSVGYAPTHSIHPPTPSLDLAESPCGKVGSVISIYVTGKFLLASLLPSRQSKKG